MWDCIFEIIKILGPPLITVGIGAVIVQRFFVSRANEAAQVDYLIKELEELQRNTLEYWNLPPAAEKTQGGLLTQKIVGGLKALASDMRYFCERYCKCQSKKMEVLLANLHDACTGGDFDTNRRKIEKQRYIVIVNSINAVKSELFRRKL
jgi:hypothetical protein